MADDGNEKRKEDTTFRPEHLELLRRDINAWNKWREEHPGIVPNRLSADLAGLDLCGANLQGACLRHANLKKASLERANLGRANLEGAELSRACMEDADLRGANLQEAKLLFANLQRAKLVMCIMQGAELVSASMQGADLRFANLKGAAMGATTLVDANLDHANLDGADLREARLSGATLSNASLQGADLRDTRGLTLDSTLVRNARFSPRARDPWSILRRSYTGPKLLFNMLFLVAFLVPYIVKTAGWVSANRVQEELASTVEDFQALAENLKDEEHPMAKPMDTMLAKARQHLPSENNERWRESRVWRLVIGVEKGVTYWLTAVALIAYNVFRAMLTYYVAPMRDEEERSGHTPRFSRDFKRDAPSEKVFQAARRWLDSWSESYGWLLWPHRFVHLLFFVAVGSFLLHVVHWMSLPVWVPA